MLEYAGAFLQLYREEARYLDRTAHWMARVGIDYVKKRIVEDAAGRCALHARFLRSQSFAQQIPGPNARRAPKPMNSPRARRWREMDAIWIKVGPLPTIFLLKARGVSLGDRDGRWRCSARARTMSSRCMTDARTAGSAIRRHRAWPSGHLPAA